MKSSAYLCAVLLTCRSVLLPAYHDGGGLTIKLKTSLVMYIKRMTYTVEFRGNAVTMTTAEGGFVCKGVSIRRRGTVFGLLACTVSYRIDTVQYSTIRYDTVRVALPSNKKAPSH